jgi:hypothetical protein
MSEDKIPYGKTRGLTLKEVGINTLIERLEDIQPITVHIEDKEVNEIIKRFNDELGELKVLTANRLAVLQ